MSLIAVHPPSRPTLFPYTTLFRSQHRPEACLVEDRPSHRVRPIRKDAPLVVAESHRRCDATDRKSTRLNSSHVSTSYAVFCLKKKTSNRFLKERIIQQRDARCLTN